MKRILLATAFVAFANLSFAAGPSGSSPTKLIAGTGTTISPQSPCSHNCTINSTGTGGSVTNTSVAAANGFTGTVANATTTPAITIIPSGCNGVCKSNATTLSTATPGTDYLAPSATITGQVCEIWDSTLTVVANTFEFPIPWTSYTVTGMKSATNGTGSPSFTVAAKIAGTNITGLSAVSVSGSTNTVTAASGANTGSANDQLTLVVTAPSGTPNQAYVCLNITHTVN